MQSPSKKTKSMNSCENIGLECENSIKRLDVEQ